MDALPFSPVTILSSGPLRQNPVPLSSLPCFHFVLSVVLTIT